MGAVRSYCDQLFYNLSAIYRRRQGRAADMLTIKRGYGPHLLHFARWIDKMGYEDDDGLSLSELEALVR
jgi:hypothetical protein